MFSTRQLNDNSRTAHTNISDTANSNHIKFNHEGRINQQKDNSEGKEDPRNKIDNNHSSPSSSITKTLNIAQQYNSLNSDIENESSILLEHNTQQEKSPNAIRGTFGRHNNEIMESRSSDRHNSDNQDKTYQPQANKIQKHKTSTQQRRIDSFFQIRRQERNACPEEHAT